MIQHEFFFQLANMDIYATNTFFLIVLQQARLHLQNGRNFVFTLFWQQCNFGATLHLVSKQKSITTNYLRLLSLTINFLSISKFVPMVMAVALGSNSIEVHCPRCQAHVLTSVKSEPGLSAWIAGGLICFIG